MSSAFVRERDNSGISCTSLSSYIQQINNNGRMINQNLFNHTPGANMLYREHAHQTKKK
ncbi:hypothetical protein MUY27_05040 [Mucilaginibacter sp. RS28]|uniref:Uncharacterized protein n=1 Tax=Mucilaginibacter straminoryzae TaxID=2932774 RepID=A0A9X1X0T7_9SPHI|nr:hypothetical protein [Mucilaginibacter straminoryzae]MCJ8209064.1 hypothetical protein [Mucilaginibacter straminoryzae]